MKRMVIFASGSGSNAENIITFFQNRDDASVVLVLTNNPHAKVLERCKKLNVSALSFNSIAFKNTHDVLNILKATKPDLIVLAGFLWKFPEHILNEFPNKVINVHPALLPKYGGKGMHGKHVHQEVFNNNEIKSGITIHLCNKEYDKGEILFQTSVELSEQDTPEVIAEKVLALEHQYFPRVIEEYLLTEYED